MAATLTTKRRKLKQAEIYGMIDNLVCDCFGAKQVHPVCRLPLMNTRNWLKEIVLWKAQQKNRNPVA